MTICKDRTIKIMILINILLQEEVVEEGARVLGLDLLVRGLEVDICRLEIIHMRKHKICLS